MAHLLEAQGDALRIAVTGEWQKFFIKARRRGSEAEGVTQSVIVAFDGPSKPIIKFQYKPDTVIVLYKAAVCGEYKLEISKGGEAINGSPFKVTIKGAAVIQPEKIRVTGHGLHEGKVNDRREVVVDYSESNVTGVMKVAMEGPTFQMLKYGKPQISVIDGNNDGIKKIQYTPKFAGKYKLHVSFDEAKVPGSPFPVNVTE